jgi:hypothetical protein
MIAVIVGIASHLYEAANLPSCLNLALPIPTKPRHSPVFTPLPIAEVRLLKWKGGIRTETKPLSYRPFIQGVYVADHVLVFERARTAGANAASSEKLGYDDCPYDEDHEPILRAMWQDGFLTTKLYGTG